MARAPLAPRRLVAAPEIPRLKEEEHRERRTAGAAWCEGPEAGGARLACQDGAGAVARVGGPAARGLLDRSAASLSRLLGGPGTVLGRMLAGPRGPAAAAAVLAVLATALLSAGARLLSRPPDLAYAVAFSGLPGSGVVIDAPRNRSLSALMAANSHEIPWDAPRPGRAAPAAPPAAAPERAQGRDADGAPAAVPAGALEGAALPDEAKGIPGGLERDGFVRKLTSDASALSGGHGAAGAVAPAAVAGAADGSASSPAPGTGGRAETTRPGTRAVVGAGRGVQRGAAAAAAGQLKLADPLSRLGGFAASDQNARAYASDAFDQSKSGRGELAGIIGGDGIVVPPGSGAPDGASASPPDLPPGVNRTPYADTMNDARDQSNQAANMKMIGAALAALGGLLMAAGLALAHQPPPAKTIGLMMFLAGMALLIAGGVLMSKAQDSAGKARRKADEVGRAYGQKDQAAIVSDCAGRAADDGTPVEACAAPNPSQNTESHEAVQEAVARESAASFTLSADAGR